MRSVLRSEEKMEFPDLKLPRQPRVILVGMGGLPAHLEDGWIGLYAWCRWIPVDPG